VVKFSGLDRKRGLKTIVQWLDGENAMDSSQSKVDSSEVSDQKWKGLYRLSGILMILIPLLVLVALYGARTLYTPLYPGDPLTYLQLVGQHQALATVSWSLWIIADFLGLAPTIAMFLILRRYNRTLALLGSLFLLAYSIYDFGITELNSLTLVSLGHEYALASSDALRAALVAAAAYGYYALPIQTVLSFAIGSIGYIFWCVPMAKSFFGRWVAAAGIIINVIGIIGSFSPLYPDSYFLGLCLFLTPRLIALWSIVLGVQLLGYVRRIPSKAKMAVQMA
jgi:hypothetical protein